MSQYPVVLLHGMFGYGQQEITERVLPYYGLWNRHIRKMFDKEGVHCVAPSLGPYSSAWNRACEAYAQLVGGTVDYGKVHSEKFGGERYGRTYKALLPEWGTTDSEGNLVKVNFIGHSFGGVTARLLTQLLIDGSKEERDGTPEDELSPLFKGGNNNLVHSITTLASPHNGATAAEKRTGKVMTEICVKICQVFNAVDSTLFQWIYDLRLDQYGITTPPELLKHDYENRTDKIRKYFFENKDNIIYDLTIKGAHELNDRIPTRDNIYYFSFRGQRTVPALFGLVQLPGVNSFPLLNVLGFFLGINITGMPNRKWLANDLVINTESGTAPDGAPRNDLLRLKNGADKSLFDSKSLKGMAKTGIKDLAKSGFNIKVAAAKKTKALVETGITDKIAKVSGIIHGDDVIKPGVWNVMPVEVKDHMSYLGWKEDKEVYENFYKNIYETVSSLPAIDK